MKTIKEIKPSDVKFAKLKKRLAPTRDERTQHYLHCDMCRKFREKRKGRRGKSDCHRWRVLLRAKYST